jgi:hypothetical protein
MSAPMFEQVKKSVICKTGSAMKELIPIYDYSFRKPERKVKKEIETEDSDSDSDDVEKQREEDLKERDEFAKRMLDKDKEKTRHVVSRSDKKVHIPDEAQFNSIQLNSLKTEGILRKSQKVI